MHAPNLDDQPPLFGLDTYRRFTHMSRSATYRAAHSGTLGVPVLRVGGRMVVRREDVRALLYGPSAA